MSACRDKSAPRGRIALPEEKTQDAAVDFSSSSLMTKDYFPLSIPPLLLKLSYLTQYSNTANCLE
jgi:hypothetical protein